MPVSRHLKHRGVGLVELMVAMSIAAALLAAVGVAVNASIKTYQINQQQASLEQRCRVALNRILSDIRSASEHGLVDATKQTRLESGLITSDTGIELISTSGAGTGLAKYAWDAPNKRVIYTVGGKDHVLLEGVDNFAVTCQPMRSPAAIKMAAKFDRVRRVAIRLTVTSTAKTADTSESGTTTSVTLSTAVVPRRNNW